MTSTIPSTVAAVYGPVQSWRFGRSLGIDPIGAVSTCSFNCVYCQLGAIQQMSDRRQVFVPTAQIRQELQSFAPDAIDTVTLSGSGEPTLAANLGEILTTAKAILPKSIGVLTNGSLLTDRTVREELAIADWIAIKVDAISADALRRINQPVSHLDLAAMWTAFQQFRQQYSGHLAIQTMLLSQWSDRDQATYIQRLQALKPDEIQLNTPTRPKPLTHQLDARGNHTPDSSPYPTHQLKPVTPEVLQSFVDRIQAELGIPVRHPFGSRAIERQE